MNGLRGLNYKMENLLMAGSAIYFDYTVFLNDSFELFCENYAELLKQSDVKINIPQPVIDEMKAVPMSRMDDYALCYHGLARIDEIVNDGIAVITEDLDGFLKVVEIEENGMIHRLW